jgi:hypothetical protein
MVQVCQSKAPRHRLSLTYSFVWPCNRQAVQRLHCRNFEVQLETKVAIAMLVGRFRVTRDPARMAFKSVKQFIEECTAYLALYQADGLHLQFQPRV